MTYFKKALVLSAMCLGFMFAIPQQASAVINPPKNADVPERKLAYVEVIIGDNYYWDIYYIDGKGNFIFVERVYRCTRF